MDINEAVRSIEVLLDQYAGTAGRKPAEATVLPSGDEKDLIKVKLAFAVPESEADEAGWARDAEKAIASALPEVAKAFRLRVKADVL